MSDSRESPQTCDSKPLVPRNGICKNRIQFGNPETIRENQAMRANLRIDSRESGHLRKIEFGSAPIYESHHIGSVESSCYPEHAPREADRASSFVNCRHTPQMACCRFGLHMRLLTPCPSIHNLRCCFAPPKVVKSSGPIFVHFHRFSLRISWTIKLFCDFF